ncbi:SAM-dependent methyltransferase [Aliarcobacter trophiarum LMG 25534]|uniref:SAM-dependent methyltransferase n=1 Tax=Aliarcobacter trophiarum LMG 25534 TaxID=1032241 RepID=A0AAD0QHA7_9BACT|nr:methyltransferase domain-containing protein [Aliarcobacter trophiarum]AXK47902.1 SAM-dependent methyltransferase [Aliarcobacter trophiarum LMG 25534]RXI28111.1 SAM-dependent methyltransferase [Aliarcobacter trophiarum]RXJ92435.1 SAM-dependent methyltransferase [Aliarcobacter trophiarum LMG 25534]
MALVNTNLDKLNFSKLYKIQMKNSTFKSKSSSDWDKKAKYFKESVVNSPYTKEFISKVDIKDCKTLLDIGSGPATISLALTNKLEKVYALDYSKEMLSYANENAKEQNIKNLVTIHKSWYDSWEDVPNADIVVASRSMEVKDIKKALQKLNDKANKRVYITTKVGGSFIDKEILEQIKRDIIPRPDYIYLVNCLHSMGIFAKVDFIQTKSSKFDTQNEDDFIQSLKWSLGDMSKKEEKILREYFNKTYKNKRTKEFITWAFISWEK